MHSQVLLITYLLIHETLLSLSITLGADPSCAYKESSFSILSYCHWPNSSPSSPEPSSPSSSSDSTFAFAIAASAPCSYHHRSLGIAPPTLPTNGTWRLLRPSGLNLSMRYTCDTAENSLLSKQWNCAKISYAQQTSSIENSQHRSFPESFPGFLYFSMLYKRLYKPRCTH